MTNRTICPIIFYVINSCSMHLSAQKRNSRHIRERDSDKKYRKAVKSFPVLLCRKKLNFDKYEDLRGKTLVFPRTPLAPLKRFSGRCPEPRKPLKRFDRNFLFRFAEFFDSLIQKIRKKLSCISFFRQRRTRIARYYIKNITPLRRSACPFPHSRPASCLRS